MDERVKKYLMSRMQEEPQSVDKVTSDVNDRDRTLNVLQGIGGFLNAGSAARGGRQVDLSNQIDSNRGRIKQAESANQRYLAGASALDGMDAEEQRKSRFKEALGKVAPGLGSAIGDADIQDVPTLANLYKSQQPQQLSPLEQARIDRLRTQTQLDQQKIDGSQSKLTEAQKVVDREFGKDYADWVAGGGYAQVDRQIKSLKEVQKGFKDGKYSTGPISSLQPDWLRKRTMPESFGAEERVKEVVQGNLRLILGAQFTEREGQQLIERAYNPALSEEENMRRLKSLRTQMKRAAEAKNAAAQYYEQNGTLAGYKGPTAREVLFSEPSTPTESAEDEDDLDAEDEDDLDSLSYEELMMEYERLKKGR